ncbi:MAG: choice-of-anchor D domain-containing protein, partial [Candidatus Acidiferrales bacterium]
MRRVLLFSAFVLCLYANANAQSPKPAMKAQATRPAATASPSPAAVQAARASFAKLPLSFEENVGQTDGRVKYMSRGWGYNLFLTADQAVFALRDGSAPPNCIGLSRKITQDCTHPSNQRNQESVLWLSMVGANPSAQILGSDLLPGKINYYVGNDPSKWRTGVRQFGRVNYRGIYPGVDLTYYGNQQQLESDFVVAPGSNPRSIQFEVKGARETRIDAQGNLILGSEAGDVRLLRPVVYQVIKGSKQDVSGRYVLLAENRVGFEIGKYDAHEPLVIDPTFVYSTYLGGATLFSGGDQGLAVAIDAAGAAYVTGMGGSSDFPGSALSGPVAQSTPFAFVTKFDPTGSSLVYSTLLRGTTGSSDSGNGIGVDSSGNAYVDGITGDSDFPLLNPFQATIGDVFSAGFNFLQSGFVAGLAGDGTLIYSTYFGGRNNADQTTLNGLAADASGNAYVVGNTNSQNFPTVNPVQATQNSTFGGQNVVVAKFNPQGQPIYSTYLGGGGSDIGDAIAIDGNGNAYVTGQTSSNAMFETGFPVQPAPAPFQGAINGSANAFVAKFTFAGSTLTMENSTYLGGSDTDEGFGIAVDTATPPNVYVTGQTNSKTGTPFPTKNPIFGPSAGTFSEAFVTKLKGDFTALIYSTFLGGTGSASSSTGDTGSAIGLDGANPPNAFVTGSTASIDFPVASPLQSTIGPLATSNAFVTEVNGAGSALTYSTYLGGSGTDKGLGIAVDSTGNAYIAGTATSPNFPVVGSGGGAPYQGELRTSAGNAFLTKISSAAAPSAMNFFPPSFNFHSVGVGQASAPESVTLSNNTGSAVTINVGGITFTGANAGDFSQTNTCPVSPATLGAGASCTISVVFNPTLQDGRTAQLSVASSAPAAAMNLSGFGAVPEVSFSQTSINFGTNDPLNVGVTNFLSITNKGGAPLHVGNVEITGPDASAFAVTFNDCTAAVAANGGSCFIEPTFTPTTAGHAYSATLLINDDAAGSPQSFPMSGTGVAQVIVSPHSLEFGGWLVGTSSFDNSISVQNGTSGNITLTSIAPDGNSGDFPIDPNNGTTCVANLVLLPGVSCNLDLSFKPTVGSAFDGRTATYTFNWMGAASGSQAVTVMGTGETGFTLYQNSYTAPSEFVGATESRTNFDQVFNGNAFPVTVSSIVITGANPQDFVVQLDTSCSTNGVVAANSVCFLDGSFSPSAVGTRSATVTINYAPPGGSSLILNVTGTGLAGPVVFPATYDMGSQIVGLTGPTQRVVLQNVQKAQLAISAVTPPAGTEFAIASSSTCKSGVNVPGGGNCFFDLTFKPGATGSRTASIVVTDNGPGSPRTLNLTGAGEPAAGTISVSPNALDFGNVVLVVPSSAQPTVSETFYLINAGATSTTISIAPAVTTAGTPFALATGGAAGTCVLNKVVLPQGGACTVVVTFKPTGTGLQSNSVTLTDTVGGLHTISIQGTGVNQGVMSFGSAPTFTQLPSTTTATPLTATLTNSGSGPLTINSLYLTGANATDFAIVPGQTTCAPGTTGMIIPAAPGPGNTCVVALTFTAPNTVGTYKANVSVSADLGNNVKGSTSTSLTGNVVAGGVSASPNPIDLGTVALGSTITYSSLHSFNSITVTNNNPATITITSVAPQTAGDFTVSSNSCLTTLQPPAQFSFTNTCTFDVTFTPTVNGTEPTNKIVVTYNVTGGASGQQYLIPLTGVGSNALVAMPNPLNVSTAVGNTLNPTITIGNGSASTINITAVGAITGPGAANYTISFEFCTGTALQPSGSAFGTTCQISLNYVPTAPGTNVAAQIPVSYNIGGGATQMLAVNLSGSATAAQVSITPSQTPPTPLVFPSPGLPNQVVNTQSLVLSVLVTNTGNDVLNITGVKITGANSNDFALAPQNSNSGSQYPTINACSSFGFGNSIQPGQSCTIPLTFTPAPPPLPGGSTRSATLTITDNAYPSKTQTVLLEGNATSGSVTVSPTNISFPDTNVGSSATQSVLVRNSSSSAVTVTSVTFGTTSYSVDAAQTLNACSSSKPLSAFTGSCVVYIKFSPKTGANPDMATIHTSSNSPTVTLSGNGVNPNVNATPTTLTFSSQLVGTSSSPQAVTLNNPTGTAVTISSTPSISGTNPADFTLGTNSCTTGANVPATTGSCVVNVIFKPGAAGGTGRTATLSISDSPDATSPHLVSLSGTAIQPVASLSGSTIAFGNSNVGVATSQMTVTLTNTGNANLSLSNIALGGTNPGDFAIVVPSSGTQCTNTTVLAASASCVVAATFTPTAANARSATITITDDATPTTQVITLSGSGTQPGVSFLPTTIPFGNQRQGVASGPMTTVLTNSGTGTLTITSVTLMGTNPGDFALV